MNEKEKVLFGIDLSVWISQTGCITSSYLLGKPEVQMSQLFITKSKGSLVFFQMRSGSRFHVPTLSRRV